MNQKESRELFQQGENAWNTWANDLLTEKNALKLADIWMGGDKSEWNDETSSWHKKAKADFSNHSFESDVDFSNFHFPGEVSFRSANFQKYANLETQLLRRWLIFVKQSLAAMHILNLPSLKEALHSRELLSLG